VSKAISLISVMFQINVEKLFTYRLNKTTRHSACRTEMPLIYDVEMLKTSTPRTAYASVPHNILRSSVIGCDGKY